MSIGIPSYPLLWPDVEWTNGPVLFLGPTSVSARCGRCQMFLTEASPNVRKYVKRPCKEPAGMSLYWRCMERGDTLIQDVEMPSFEGVEQGPATLASARKCVDWMVLVVFQLNKNAAFELQTSALIHDLVIASASQAALLCRRRLSDQARTSLIHSWLDQSLLLRPSWERMRTLRNELVHGLFTESEAKLEPSEIDREFLLLFSLAASERLRTDSAESQARQSLRNLMSRLELSAEELAHLAEVARNDIVEWESGRQRIPADRQPALNKASSGVSRLLSLFRPERLPQVIRRKIDLFEGESALDWILQGRTDEVVERYESALTYQE
jgi:DNA-binding XRE family transcriptional regulator